MPTLTTSASRGVSIKIKRVFGIKECTLGQQGRQINKGYMPWAPYIGSLEAITFGQINTQIIMRRLCLMLTIFVLAFSCTSFETEEYLKEETKALVDLIPENKLFK